jgi:hypothetical protein
MSFLQTQAALIDALKLPKTPVIALHGLWGTGKTHLWHEVSAEVKRDKEFAALYVSCMAYSSIASLKSAVTAMMLSRTSGVAKHGESLAKYLIGFVNKKFLPEELHISTSLSDFQVFLPQLKSLLPKETLLVFDDIERAAELDLRELLGFVSFLVEQLGARVLLILNKEKLGGQQQAWEQLREKIVSIEIALQTKPDDCVAIGLGTLPRKQFDVFAERVRQLKVTNIRALQHMRRTYDALVAAQRLDDNQWVQLIPSVVLFVALHFNVVENGPTVEQVLNPGALFARKPLELTDEQFARESKEFTDEQKRIQQFLSDYRFGNPDDFETKVLLPYLQTGFLDKQAFASYVNELARRRRKEEAEVAVNAFMMQEYWGATQSKDELLAFLNALRSHVAFVDGGRATWLAKKAVELDAPELSRAIVRDWIDAHKSFFASADLAEDWFEFSIVTDELHLDIQAAYRARYDELYPPLSLSEAIEYLNKNSSWGSRQSRPIENATRTEIETLVRTSSPEVRRVLFRFFFQYLRGRIQGGSFRPVADVFAEVCKGIVASEPDSRLAFVIRRAFKSEELASLVETPGAPST